jgi:dienelactone hydrolase
LRLRLGLLLTVIAVLSVAVPAQAQRFNDSYQRSANGSCSVTAGIYGNEPAEAGTYPVLIYTHGTGGLHNGAEAKALVDRAAARGFVAGSVSYNSFDFGNFFTTGLARTAGCIYGPNSALTKLCARPKADCSRVVAAGFSQGAALAIRARLNDPRVQRSLLYGYGDAHSGDAWHNRPDLLVVDGEAEAVPLEKLNATTGMSCAGGFDCRRDDGSGWLVVPNAEMADGEADHCWMHGGDKCSWFPPFEQKWLNGGLPWSLEPSLSWLRG